MTAKGRASDTVPAEKSQIKFDLSASRGNSNIDDLFSAKLAGLIDNVFLVPVVSMLRCAIDRLPESASGQQHDSEVPSVYSRSTPVSGNTGSTFSFTLDSERFMMLAGTETAGHMQSLGSLNGCGK